MTITETSTGPVLTAPEATRREQSGPADSAKPNPPTSRNSAAMPWVMLIGAVAMSLGSNVFAVLQDGHNARSFGGVIYGAWPTTAFLAAAWLWHQEGRDGSGHRGFWRAALVWLLRLAVAGPAAYVSLLHVHATAMHFNQPGTMAWAEAVGMEAVTALALVVLDDGHARRRVDEGQAVKVDEGQAHEDAEAARLLEQIPVPGDVDEPATRGAAVLASVQADIATTGRRRPHRAYAEQHGVTRQYVSALLKEQEA